MASARRGIPLTGVDRFDRPAAACLHFARAMAAIRRRGFKVKLRMSTPAYQPAWIDVGERQFVLNPRHATSLDLRHELRHFRQFKLAGSLRVRGGRSQRYERDAYAFERRLARRHGFASEYVQFLDRVIRYYEDQIDVFGKEI